MNAIIENDLGKISFDEGALKQLIGMIVIENYGILGMASKNPTDGFVELLKKDSISKGVKVEIIDNKIIIDLYVIVKYGISIKTVAENIIENVKYALKENTSLDATTVNVIVQEIRL